MRFFKGLASALALLGLFPYLIAHDGVGGPGAPSPDDSTLDLSAYRLKKFPMAHRLK